MDFKSEKNSAGFLDAKEKSFTTHFVKILCLFSNSAATLANFSWFLATKIKLNPKPAKFSAKPNPIPSVAPVIKTQLLAPYKEKSVFAIKALKILSSSKNPLKRAHRPITKQAHSIQSNIY